jgi:hypothetical protein
MVEADIHLRLHHTSLVDIYKKFEALVCCLKGIWGTLIITLAKLSTDLGIPQGHLRSRNDAITIMFEAEIHLKLLHTSIYDLYKEIEPLEC